MPLLPNSITINTCGLCKYQGGAFMAGVVLLHHDWNINSSSCIYVLCALNGSNPPLISTGSTEALRSLAVKPRGRKRNDACYCERSRWGPGADGTGLEPGFHCNNMLIDVTLGVVRRPPRGPDGRGKCAGHVDQ